MLVTLTLLEEAARIWSNDLILLRHCDGLENPDTVSPSEFNFGTKAEFSICGEHDVRARSATEPIRSTVVTSTTRPSKVVP